MSSNFAMRSLSIGLQALSFSTPHPPLPNLHVSSFRVIPYKGQLGKWHPILDLSSPSSSSVDDGRPVVCIKAKQLICMVSKCGSGTFMANRRHLSDLPHYLDNFNTAGPPNSDQCTCNLQTGLSVYQSLGFPLHASKCTGHSTHLGQIQGWFGWFGRTP